MGKKGERYFYVEDDILADNYIKELHEKEWADFIKWKKRRNHKKNRKCH